MGVKSAKIGLDQIHYAKQTADTVAALTYGAVVAVPGAIEAKVTSENNEETLYADNAASETASSRGKVTVEIQLKDLDLDTQADLLGHTITAGVMVRNANDVAPYVAFGWRGLKANGKFRYVWLFKGKFTEPDDGYKTKGDKIEFQPATIKGTFVATEHDGNTDKLTDEDATGFVAATATAWFTSPLGE